MLRNNGGEKYATGVTTSKIRARDNIIIGTWNVTTLRMAGKLEELSYQMSRYRWNILGLCEVRWKNFSEISTQEGHKVFFSGKEVEQEQGVGFLKTLTSTKQGETNTIQYKDENCLSRNPKHSKEVETILRRTIETHSRR